jgi:hypothetical protein
VAEVVRYAEWTPPWRELVAGYVKTMLPQPLRTLLRRLERSRIVDEPWECHGGPDYTGWQVRCLYDSPGTSIGHALSVGDVGTVTGYEQQGRHRRYKVAFARTDFYTSLPAPEHLELLGPGT